MKLAEEERFPGSRPAREKPFRMHKHSREFTVRLTELEDGWNSDKLDDTQVYCNFLFQKSDQYFNTEHSIMTQRITYSKIRATVDLRIP